MPYLCKVWNSWVLIPMCTKRYRRVPPSVRLGWISHPRATTENREVWETVCCVDRKERFHQRIAVTCLHYWRMLWAGGPRFSPPQLILASRVSGCHLDTQTLKNHPSGHPNISVINFLQCQFRIYSCLFSSSEQFLWHCMRIYYALFQ